MKPAQPATIEALDANGAGVRALFQWHGDRYGHAISLVVEGETWPLLQSIEGDEHSFWPPSPPVQELVTHERRLEPALLLMGATSCALWSASVTRRSHARRPGLHFELACRLRQEPEWLGATYRLADEVDAKPNQEGGLMLSAKARRLFVELQPAAMAVSDATQSTSMPAIELESGLVRIAAMTAGGGIAAPGTSRRWSYAFYLIRTE